jgi:hypothetical protein
LEAFSHITAIKTCGELVFIEINVIDVTDVAVIDFLVIAVLNLHAYIRNDDFMAPDPMSG